MIAGWNVALVLRKPGNISGVYILLPEPSANAIMLYEEGSVHAILQILG